MSQFRDPTKKQSAPWRAEVAEHYAKHSLSQDFHEELAVKLMNLPLAGDASFAASSRMNHVAVAHPTKATGFFLSLHRSGVGYLLSAGLAAVATFGLVSVDSESSSDPIAELANQPGPRGLPADFDLEGDPDAFAELMQDAFPKKDFMLSQLPKEVLKGYKPSEARLFFTGSGQPGVSIQLNSSNKADNGAITMLYIVQLGENNSKGFPREKKVTRNLVSRAGKQKRVNAWRDEKFGYAMVQQMALSDEVRP
jgi:hypothetical protein